MSRRGSLERQALGLVGEIYEAALVPERWPGVLRALEQAFGADTLVLALTMGDAERPQPYVHWVNMDAAHIESYAQHYHRHDVVAQALRALPPGRARRREDVIPDRDFFRSVIYNELNRAQRIRSILSAMLEPHPASGGISISRRPGRRAFSEAHRAFLELLTPHIRRAVETQRRLGTLHAEGAALADTLDRMTAAVLLVARGGVVLRVNRAAEKVLGQAGGLRLDRGHLSGATPAQTAALRRLIGAASETGAGAGLDAGAALAIPRPAPRRPLNVLVTPLHGSASPLLLDRRAVAAVFVSDPDELPAIDAGRLQTWYGLTAAEARLAALLSTGASLDQAAELFRVTHNTLRTQVRRLFEKTGTRRQADLMRVLLAGPRARP